MILQRLIEFANRVSDDLAPPGYAPMKVRWIVELDKAGKLLGATRTESEGKQKYIRRMAPNLELTGKRSSGIKAGLMADNAEYALKRPTVLKKTDAKKLEAKHADFKKKVDDCCEELGLSSIQAVQTFLKEGLDSAESILDEIDGGDNVMFRVDGVCPTDLPEVCDYWYKTQTDSMHRGTCMLCASGDVGLVKLQPVTLKSIPGGQTSGVALVSANDDPFESYGLKSALIAPMCMSCAELSHKAINYLIGSKRQSFRLGNRVLFLFWSRAGMSFDISNLFSEPTEESVKALFEAPSKGAAAALDLDSNSFYTLALSGSGGRAVVRDWIETTLNNVQLNLRNYFTAQKIAGGKKQYQKLLALAGATVRVLDDLAPWVSLALFNHALKGAPLPPALLSQAIRRCVVGKVNPGTRKREHVSAQQAALIKLCFYSLRKSKGINIPEDWMMKLDQDYEEPAYLYGRLFNVLEQIQEAATGGNSVERTFGTAIMSPVSTLPRLIGRSTVHIRKLMRDKRGAAINYSKLLSEIQGKLSPCPAYKKQMDMHEQGLFVLGYWHQNAARYEKRSDNVTKEVKTIKE